MSVTTDYHQGVERLCEAPTSSEVVCTADIVDGLVFAASDIDFPIVGIVTYSRIHEFSLGDSATQLSVRLETTIFFAHSRGLHSGSLVRRLVEKPLF